MKELKTRIISVPLTAQEIEERKDMHFNLYLQVQNEENDLIDVKELFKRRIKDLKAKLETVTLELKTGHQSILVEVQEEQQQVVHFGSKDDENLSSPWNEKQSA